MFRRDVSCVAIPAWYLLWRNCRDCMRADYPPLASLPLLLDRGQGLAVSCWGCFPLWWEPCRPPTVWFPPLFCAALRSCPACRHPSPSGRDRDAPSSGGSVGPSAPSAFTGGDSKRSCRHPARRPPCLSARPCRLPLAACVGMRRTGTGDAMLDPTSPQGTRRAYANALRKG
jgi:hypothetical protein